MMANILKCCQHGNALIDGEREERHCQSRCLLPFSIPISRTRAFEVLLC